MLRLGTRQTALAIAQAEEVKRLLLKRGVIVSIVTMCTEGDHIQGTIAENGGKGVFVKKIEEALLRGEIDCAVHSYKDMPFFETPELVVAAVPKRLNPRDVLLVNARSKKMDSEEVLLIGTSSLRRRYQLQRRFPKFSAQNIRGSVLTRIDKMKTGGVDGLVLAMAGLQRLGQTDQISRFFALEDLVPAVGQGALALQCRDDDRKTYQILRLVNDEISEKVMTCERSFIKTIEGGCTTPVGGHLSLEGPSPVFYGFLADPKGCQMVSIREPFDISFDWSQKGRLYAEHLMEMLEKKAVAS